MVPAYFSASESPLFGLLHEPEGEARGHGVLLCPPVGQEHVRAHWALRQVGLSLSRAGFHCFRFDWFGVGDSAGELASATLDAWMDNAVQAAQELRDAGGVRKVSIVGLRLGATIAALAASRIRPSCVVLWDPVLEGARHLAEMRQLHREVLSDRRRYWQAGRRHPGPAELLGFDFGEGLLAEIERLNVARVAALPKARVCLVRSTPGAELEGFSELLRGRKLDVELHTTEMRARWSSADDVEELLLPADAVRTITAFLERRAS